MKKTAIIMSVLCLAAVCARAQVVISDSDKARAAELVKQMTLDEKIDYIAGARSFFTHAIPRLGIPEIRMADGPQGIRNNTVSTLFPCGILTASTWNRDLGRRLGHSLGQDAKARGVSILLGPGVNIYRAPLCGRNFEYFGEDPYLAGETAVQYILGVQEEGVMATVKHFAANNQERSRHRMSSDVDERTLQEIYFPAFRKAVQEAKVGAVMDSYNLVNSVHSTENAWMNIEVLRNQWGFEGIVMSDWTSVYSTLGAVKGGLDMECPKGVFFTRARIKPLLENGVICESQIDEKVQHILQTFIAFGFFDSPRKDASIPEDNPESRQTALDIAREGVVLLKNEGALPFARKAKVLVMGPNAGTIPTGGGSGFVTPFSSVSIADGLKAVLGEKRVTVLSDDTLFASILSDIRTGAKTGFRARYYLGEKLEGNPLLDTVEPDPSHRWRYGSPMKELPDDGFSVRWEGTYCPVTDGLLRFVLSGDDGYRLSVNGKRLGGDWGNHALSTRTVFLNVEAGRDYDICFEFYEHAGEATVGFEAGMLDEALLQKSLAACTDVVYCAGFHSDIEGEGFDRPFELPDSQLDMLERLGGKRLTVIINAGGGVDFSGWSEHADAIMMAWYPGQEGGTAIAELLSGKASPSGKLPISIEKRWEDNPVHDSYFDDSGRNRTTYSEGLFVGYRGYDRSGIAPLFPFGFGLSYTSFSYSNISVEKVADGVEVSFDVTNTGKKDAMETAQVYVHDVASSVLRPYKELKGFDKKMVQKGKTVRFSVTLGPDAFSFYDVASGSFKLEPGEFEILAGPSSADLPLKTTIVL
ncbi:MAG: glycoside hydrolase family 3 C-terminal domain-containing protein [Bacteroidales bacterium]|nr:glycoside hydrolase family 3 C-terminal domain-containing protein [Bacteroidales bacterium]